MRRLVVTATLAVVAVVVWWRARVEGSIWILDLNLLNYDTYDYYYPTFRYGFERVGRGELPWWNPYQLCGTPFFATGQHLLLYPLNALYLLFPTPTAMKGTAILHFALGLLFTFALGRVLGLSAVAALTAGIVFAFCGSLVGLLYIPHHLYGAVWMPLVLALADRVWTRPRRAPWAVALGAALACQYLGGYPNYSLFSVYLLGGYVAWRLAGAFFEGEGSGAWLARAAALAGAGGVALVLSAPQLLPAIELARQSPRAFGALSLATADPAELAALTRPSGLLKGALFPLHDVGIPVYGYVGLGGLVLAGLALFDRLRRREVILFGAIAVLGWFLAFGTHTPVYRLYFRLPTGDWFRLPARFLVPASLGVAVLAGIGADFLARDRRARAPAAVLVTIVVAVVAWRARGPAIFPATAHMAILAGWFALNEVLRGRRWHPAVVAGLPVLVYAELFVGFVNIVPIPETHPHFRDLPAAVVEYVRAHQGYGRTHLVMPPLDPMHIERLPLKAGMTYGLFTIADRENVYSERYQEYVARMDGHMPGLGGLPQGEVHVTARSPNLRLLDLLGVRFVLDSRGARFRDGAAADRFPLRYEGGGVRVLENPTALPRAYVVGQAEVIAEPARVLDRLVDPVFDPTRAVILEEVPHEGLRAGGGGRAEITRYTPELVTIRATTDSAGFLVLTDQLYPGWAVEVDGEPRRLYRANYLFRAVALDAGTHEVVFRFRPSFLRALVG